MPTVSTHGHILTTRYTPWLVISIAQRLTSIFWLRPCPIKVRMVVEVLYFNGHVRLPGLLMLTVHRTAGAPRPRPGSSRSNTCGARRAVYRLGRLTSAADAALGPRRRGRRSGGCRLWVDPTRGRPRGRPHPGEAPWTSLPAQHPLRQVTE
jgi:hypothetical protein